MNILVIANPKSGSYNKELLDNTISILNKKMGKTELVYTKCPGDATNITLESNSSDLIIAAGGDGLINEVAAGMNDKKQCLFSALAFGTRNVFCIEHKIPLNPIKAIDKLTFNIVKKIPLGFIGNKSFTLMCGFGYDANVVKKVVIKQYSKRKTLAHIKEGINSLFNEYDKITAYINGKTINGYHIIVSLAQNYAGNFKLCKEINKNKFNVFILKDIGKIHLLKTALSMGLGLGFTANPIYTDIIKINGTSEVQIDGEFYNTNSMQNYLYIKKDAINLII